MGYAGREESFEYEALRRAEKIANKKKAKKKSLIARIKELIGAR
jgi:hypothetical protein